MPAQKFVKRHSLTILNMEPTNIPSNNSHQELMSDGECDSLKTVPSLTSIADGAGNRTGRCGYGISIREWLTIIILFLVNLINYMDRFTIAGILNDVKAEFNIGDDLAGLLQTAFVLSYMIFAPLFGYLGDRYSRRLIMASGVLLWSLTTFLGSFMHTYGWFLTLRALVGIGEASYSTIAPTIISDLFVKDMRSKMLALFYFAIPVGSGLGYIVGSEMAHVTGSWQWGLRVTPIIGVIAVLLVIFVMHDPVRGNSEGSHLRPTTWGNDLSELCKNKSFMLSTAGFTCVSFVAGALAWWGPTFVYQGLRLQQGYEDVTLNDVTYKFGIITMVSGLVGVPLGSVLAQRLRTRFPRIDPLICAVGLLVSSPLLFGASLFASVNCNVCYALIFFGEVFLNLNWSIVADILLYVVIPTRRSTAEAFQILISHALGDAGSPYLVGVISETLKVVLSPSHSPHVTSSNGSFSLASNITSDPTSDPAVDFYSLQYSLFMTCFFEVIGGFFFLFTALYISRDKYQAEKAIAAEGTELKAQLQKATADT
ncbi:protein spinster isoform X2 [Zootermopsis nevadensis]|uniref:protein spinster isoform X2 n=1 Tax=Zootermopsis nevadensis TaxID=136037 RepID=UPI000B8E8055|nr:protein spinster isoform X2 [Zootermopsis nevadensis]